MLKFIHMWWIAIVAVIGIIIIVLIVVAVDTRSHNRGDYGDGGGIQIGGNQHIKFLSPTTDKAGIRGEKKTNYNLRPLLRKDEYLLVNLLIPLKNDSKAEIDSIIVSRKGIFCVEIKNWVGHIGGTENDEYWHQIYDDPSMQNRIHKNPIKQNESHCEIIEKLLQYDYPVQNIVIFVNLEDGRSIQANNVFTLRGFKQCYRALEANELNIEQIEYVCKKLCPYVATEEELEEHRKSIKKRFN